MHDHSGTHVALPSLTKMQDSESLSDASTTLTDSGFSFRLRSICVGVALANFFMLMSAEASTLRWPFVSYRGHRGADGRWSEN